MTTDLITINERLQYNWICSMFKVQKVDTTIASEDKKMKF